MQPVLSETINTLIPLALPVAEPSPSSETAILAVDDLEFDPENEWGGEDADEDDGFAASIQEHGILQPPRVRPSNIPFKWIVTVGERRVREVRRLGYATILCSIDTLPPDSIRSHIERIAENIHRRRGRPMALARSLGKLQVKAGYNLVQLTKAVKLDETFVSRKLSLLRFSPGVQAAIDDGRLPESTAIEIAKQDDEAAREALAQRAMRQKLTRDQVVAILANGQKRRLRASSKTRPVRRVLCRLPGGATVAVTCPEGIDSLTTEITRDTVEYALQLLRKALRQGIAAADLGSHFNKLLPKERQGVEGADGMA